MASKTFFFKSANADKKNIYSARDPFSRRMLFLALAMMAGCCYELGDFSLNGEDNNLTEALLWAILGMLAVVAAKTGSSYRFTFSTAFWLCITYVFYFLLKAIDSYEYIAPDPMRLALLSSLTFLVGYYIGQFIWPTQSILRVRPTPGMSGTEPLYYWLLSSYVFFKLLGIAIMVSAGGGGGSALEVAQSTQNAGASYLFMIPKLATIIYFIVILLAYKHGIYRKTAFFLTIFILLEAIAGAARFTIATTVLIHLLLCHLYVRPVRLIYIAALGPLLALVVVFFGIVRDIQLGSIDAYIETFNGLVENSDTIFKLFMNRMDMLPQMAAAFDLDVQGKLKFEGGMSYIYSFLHAIPRNIWPEKPPLTAAYLTELVQPDVFADGVNIYPSVMLEAYINFFWPGTVLVGTILAGLSSLYERALLRGSLRSQALALLAFTFPMQIINEGFHSNVLGVFIYLALLYAVWLLLGRAIMGAGIAKRLAHP